MNYNSEEKHLELDLIQEGYEPAMLLQHEDVKSIRINKYSGSLELPTEIHKVDTIYISVVDMEKTYLAPVNLDKLNYLKNLTLWSYFDIKNLSPMPNLEIFSTIIKNPDKIKTIAEKFPNLKRLEIWGSAQPNQKIPLELGNFPLLEYLEFVNFSFSELPQEIANLKSLKTLIIRGGGRVLKFPEAICSLAWLEELHYRQEITSLPKQFIHLKSLKKLFFRSAFNDGVMMPEKKINLQPVPDVIGTLPSLEELDLSCCGLVSLDFLKNAKQLKKLIINFSGLKNLDDLSGMENLEELNLYGSNILSDISGIANLPVKSLDASGCRDITSIEVINSLPLLEELNIKDGGEIEDFELLYNHPTLKTLEADDRIKKQWELREFYKNLLPLESILQDIESNKIELFEKAIFSLKLHVDKNSSNNFNPLAGYFGEEPDNSAMVHLKSLENVFIQLKSNLNTETLLTLVDISMHSVIEDNYYITVLAIEEICNRKDANAQIKVIEQFRRACEYYDFGHRMHDDTVLDKLYDNLFPKFETEALIELLKNANDYMMNCQGGDGADRCFIPAFEKIKYEEQYNELITIFLGYKKSTIRYLGKEYFTKLQCEIEGNTGNYFEKIDADSNKLYTLLESEDINDYLSLIDSLENLDQTFYEENDCGIIKRINDRFTVSFEKALDMIGFYIEKERCANQIAAVVLKYFSDKGLPYILNYFKTNENNHSIFIYSVIIEIIHELNKKDIPMAEINPFYEYLVDSRRYDLNMLCERELGSLVGEIPYLNNPESMLKRLEEIAAMVQGILNIQKLDFLNINLLYLADPGEKWDYIKRIAFALFPILPQYSVVSSLHWAMIAAIESDDRTTYNNLKKYIPTDNKHNAPAYVLACAFAHFGEKDQMLVWMKESISLSQPKRSFMENPDFAGYMNDKDFLAVLEGR